MSELYDAMHAPAEPPPDPEREYGLACLIVEQYAFACRHGCKRGDQRELKKFKLATDYLIQRNTVQINGDV